MQGFAKLDLVTRYAVEGAMGMDKVLAHVPAAEVPGDVAALLDQLRAMGKALNARVRRATSLP